MHSSFLYYIIKLAEDRPIWIS